MADWVPVYNQVWVEPRMKLLADRLRIPLAQAIGHCVGVWLETASLSPLRGHIADISNVTLAAMAHWPGRSDRFAVAFRELFQDEQGQIRHWYRYTGRNLETRQHKLEAKRAERARGRSQPPSPPPSPRRSPPINQSVVTTPTPSSAAAGLTSSPAAATERSNGEQPEPGTPVTGIDEFGQQWRGQLEKPLSNITPADPLFPLKTEGLAPTPVTGKRAELPEAPLSPVEAPLSPVATLTPEQQRKRDDYRAAAAAARARGADHGTLGS